MASNNSLQKLLVNVPSASCDKFIKQYINSDWDGTVDTVANTVALPEVAANHDTAYDNKVVFLAKYHAIFTQGALFGYDKDFHNILRDLIAGVIVGESTNKGIKVTTKLTYEGEKLVVTNTVDVTPTTYNSNDGWSNTEMTNVIDAQSVKNYVDHEVKTAVDAAAVTAMEYKGGLTQADFDGFANVEDKKSLDGNVWVAEEVITVKPATETEKAVIAEKGDTIIVHYDESLESKLDYVVIERNVDNTVTVGDINKYTAGQVLVAGDDQTAVTTGYEIGSDDTTAFGTAYTLATEVAVSAAISSAIDAIDEAKSTHTGTYVTYAYSTTNGITHVDSIDPILSTVTVTDGVLSSASVGLVDHNALNTVIGYLDGKINAVDCEVTTLTEVSDSDYFSVTEDSENKTDNDRNYTIALNVVSLGDAVGMTYDEATGKWSAPEGSTAVNGLASAADVANELINDEKVVAAALNDHEARLDAIENDIDNLGETITSSFEALDGTATATDANSYVSVTINEVDGKLTNEGSSLTVQYGTVDADLQVTANGLIDAAQLANVLNNINLWETFNPEA
jgi:hypothetical protein